MTVLAVIASLLYATAFVLLCLLHTTDPSVRWVADPVSNYGIGSRAGTFRLYGHAGTVAAILLAIQIFESQTPVFPPSALVSMALLPLFRIGVILVPTDPSDQPVTRRGRLHLLFAVGSFAATYTAIANATPVLPATSAPLLVASLVTLRYVALASLVAVVVTMWRPLKAWFGLAERIFIGSTLLWFLLCSLWFVASL